jgi:biotin carboxyl carrier protein
MKMELVIKAEGPCKIVKIFVSEGEFVEASQNLVELQYS